MKRKSCFLFRYIYFFNRNPTNWPIFGTLLKNSRTPKWAKNKQHSVMKILSHCRGPFISNKTIAFPCFFSQIYQNYIRNETFWPICHFFCCRFCLFSRATHYDVYSVYTAQCSVFVYPQNNVSSLCPSFPFKFCVERIKWYKNFLVIVLLFNFFVYF